MFESSGAVPDRVSSGGDHHIGSDIGANVWRSQHQLVSINSELSADLIDSVD